VQVQRYFGRKKFLSLGVLKVNKAIMKKQARNKALAAAITMFVLSSTAVFHMSATQGYLHRLTHVTDYSKSKLLKFREIFAQILWLAYSVPSGMKMQ
jgi:hypothetical protein